MHPNAFLRTFWRLEVRPHVFVAMSFRPDYLARYHEVIVPAVTSLTVGGTALSPYRVDTSQSGDSILTDIVEGIAHSQLILAGLSSVGNDSHTGESFRNGNVMYEVGVALACRQPHDVLLVRDDKDKFLFDVSTIPHMTIDFTDVVAARAALNGALAARLQEQTYVNDARVRIAVASLSNTELTLLTELAVLPEGVARGQGLALTVLQLTRRQSWGC